MPRSDAFSMLPSPGRDGRSFLLADGGPPSEFVSELIGGGYDVDVFGRPPEGRRVLSAMHQADGWSAGKTPATGASSTAVRIFRFASKQRVPVPAVEAAFPSGPTRLTTAPTAAGKSRPVPSATAG